MYPFGLYIQWKGTRSRTEIPGRARRNWFVRKVQTDALLSDDHPLTHTRLHNVINKAHGCMTPHNVLTRRPTLLFDFCNTNANLFQIINILIIDDSASISLSRSVQSNIIINPEYKNKPSIDFFYPSTTRSATKNSVKLLKLNCKNYKQFA